MQRKHLLLLTFSIFVLLLILGFNYAAVTICRPSTDEGPTASIFLEPTSPVGGGTVSVRLTTSKNVAVVPAPLIFAESDCSITMISLSGVVPGTTFQGILNVDESVAEGAGYFLLLTKDALVDEEGKTGDEIVSGKYMRIDKTPPSRPRKLQATFNQGT